MQAGDIAERLARVQERVAAACARAGRSTDEVRIVAVTKRIPLPLVVASCQAGQWDLGENRIQDAVRRAAELPPLLAAADLDSSAVRWHFIGHLQRNKASKAVGSYALLHAVDSARLVERLESLAAASGLLERILVEVNLTREQQKYGVFPEAAAELIASCASCEHLEPRGLMTMARYGADPGELRHTFAALRRLPDACRTSCGLPLPELSMGMTGDFEAAIAEGATIIRIGTAIFGPRS